MTMRIMRQRTHTHRRVALRAQGFRWSVSPRRAFSLIELLVVIAILGLLIALLLPAVQAARESARRATCLNSMRQLMLAFHSHLEAKGAFPPARVNITGRQHGWIVDLLPYFEQQSLAGIYRLDKDFFAVENQPAGQTPLPHAVCPSAPRSAADRIYPLTTAGGMPYGTSGASADYSVAYLLNAVSAVSTGAPYTSDNLPPVLYAGPGEDNKPHPVVKIADGLANTALILEQASRPEHYVLGVKQATSANLQFPNWWMSWASQRVLAYQGYAADGVSVGAACAINCNNSQGIYSFHPGGANVTFCDGSARFVADAVPVRLMFALLTRAAGEPIERETDH